MDNKRIAFQGEPGAYSEEALFLLEPRAQSQPYREFRDVTQAVVDGRADLGLLPIENSLVGSIATNFDLIAESGLAIVGEVVSSVHHCLLGLAGASRDSLRRVLSHPVALALAPLAAAGLNLTKLESRPDRTTPWEYLFYLDIEARAADPAMAGAIRDLEAQGAVVIVLGDYPRFTPRA